MRLNKIVTESINSFLLEEGFDTKFKYFIRFLDSISMQQTSTETEDANNFDVTNYVSIEDFYKNCFIDDDATIGMQIGNACQEFIKEKGMDMTDDEKDYLEEAWDESIELYEYVVSTILPKYGLDADEFRNYFYRSYCEYFNGWIFNYEFNVVNGEVYCERGIAIDEAIQEYEKYDGIGLCWSYREGGGTTEYGGGCGSSIILIGSVPLSSIDWVTTLWIYMCYPDGEYELRLKSNAIVNVTKAYSEEDDEEYTFPQPLHITTGNYYNE